MFYIKLEENSIYPEEFNFIKIINKIKNRFNKIEIKKIDCIVINQVRDLLIIKDLSNKTLKKISEYIRINCENFVCLSDNLSINKRFIEFIKNENVQIVDGRWLYKYLVGDIVDYISNCKKEKVEFQEISILTHDINQIVINTIRELALRVKILNVLTDKEKGVYRCKYCETMKEEE